MLGYMISEATRVLPQMSLGNIKKILISIAYLAIHPGNEFLEGLEQALERKNASYDKESGTLVLHGLGVLDAVLSHHCGEDRYPVKRIYDHLMSQPEFVGKIWDSPDYKQINMMADVDLWFTSRTRWTYQKTNDDWKSSGLEENVAKVLEACNAKISPQIEIEGVNHPIDLSFWWNDVCGHIECDGKTHMIKLCASNDIYINGRSIFQSGLFQRVAPAPLIRIPSYVYNNHENDPEYWVEFMKKVGGMQNKTSHILLHGKSPNMQPIRVIQPVAA